MATVIASGITTKKELKQLVSEFNAGHDVRGLRFRDPSVFPPVINNGGHFGLRYFQEQVDINEFLCTNHPKRSWFAKVEKVGERIKVS